MSKKITVAFDVNNTLTNPLVRALFQALDRDTCHIIVWSTMGVDYAKDFCEQYDLAVDEYREKQDSRVDIAVDDIPGSIHSANVVLGVFG